MSAVAVWQSSDADLLAELAALETQLHSTWAQMLSDALSRRRNRFPGYGARVGVWQHGGVGSSTDTRAEVEAELARHARTLDAGQLAILGRRILAYLDQDGRRPNDTP
jgi:hypothetical protein